jgi:hypothetical protein
MQTPVTPTNHHVFQMIKRSGEQKPRANYSILPTAHASPFTQPESRFQEYTSKVTDSKTFKELALLIAASHMPSNLRFNCGFPVAQHDTFELNTDMHVSRSPQISATSLLGQLQATEQDLANNVLEGVAYLQQIASTNLQHLKLPLPPTQSKTSLDFGACSEEVSEVAECWKGVQLEKWLEAAMQAKGPALQLQTFLAVCCDDDIQNWISVVKEKCCQLLTHHLGCYILVQLITRSEPFAKFITSVIFTHFDSLLKNENASRAMQALAKHHDPFRREVLKSFHRQSRYYISSISAVFLFCSLIQNCKSQKEYTMIRETLFRDLELLVMSRFYKKALVTFSENCTDDDLDIVLQLITRDGKDVPSALEDKYLTHVFRVCIIRGNIRSRILFAKFISASPRIFEARKCLKMMLFRLTENLPDFYSSQDLENKMIADDIVSACRTTIIKYGALITNNDIEVFSTRFEVWNLLALIGMGNELEVSSGFQTNLANNFLACVKKVLRASHY